MAGEESEEEDDQLGDLVSELPDREAAEALSVDEDLSQAPPQLRPPVALPLLRAGTELPDKRVVRSEQVLRRGLQVPPCLLAAAIIVVITAVGIVVQYTTNIVG